MKTYLSDLIPKINRFSQKLDNITLLTNQHWVVIDELKNSKYVYIFRSNSELLISQDGKVEKGKWEYLGNNALLIEKKEESYLFRHGFFDENVLALKVDGKEEYAFLVNENKFNGEIDSIEKVFSFLEGKYLSLTKFEKPMVVASDEAKIQEDEKFSFTIKWEKQHFDLDWGFYSEYYIEFPRQRFTSVFKGDSSGKFFYAVGYEKKYFERLEDAAYELYLLKK